MVRAIAIGAFFCVLAVGCNQSPSPSFAKYSLDGGRYVVEIENTEGGATLDFNSSSETSGGNTNVTEERYNVSWGSHQLVIQNGTLTVDGTDRGKLQPGDHIMVNASGETLVNGTKR